MKLINSFTMMTVFVVSIVSSNVFAVEYSDISEKTSYKIIETFKAEIYCHNESTRRYEYMDEISIGPAKAAISGDSLTVISAYTRGGDQTLKFVLPALEQTYKQSHCYGIIEHASVPLLSRDFTFLETSKSE